MTVIIIVSSVAAFAIGFAVGWAAKNAQEQTPPK